MAWIKGFTRGFLFRMFLMALGRKVIVVRIYFIIIGAIILKLVALMDEDRNEFLMFC